MPESEKKREISVSRDGGTVLFVLVSSKPRCIPRGTQPVSWTCALKRATKTWIAARHKQHNEPNEEQSRRKVLTHSNQIGLLNVPLFHASTGDAKVTDKGLDRGSFHQTISMRVNSVPIQVLRRNPEGILASTPRARSDSITVSKSDASLAQFSLPFRQRIAPLRRICGRHEHEKWHC
jgi:hypothetical protein